MARKVGARSRAVVAGMALSAGLVPSLLAGGWIGAAPAGASACSTTVGAVGAGGCSVSTSISVLSQGTIELYAPSSLSWSFVLTGYDQWASGSAAALSGCTSSGASTTCSGGSRPTLEVIDSSGTGAGWALSAYLSSDDLPTGAVLAFDGTGSSTIGDATVAPVAADPFSATTPANECDYQAACVAATPAASCSHGAIGFTSCPAYPVGIPSSTSATHQVDLYSAAASTGEGAICFSSGSPTSAGCGGAVPDDYFNLGVPSSTASASDLSTVVNLTASSGP